MKKVIVLMILLVLLTGCSKPKEENPILNINGLYYQEDQDIYLYFDNGMVTVSRLLVDYSDQRLCKNIKIGNTELETYLNSLSIKDEDTLTDLTYDYTRLDDISKEDYINNYCDIESSEYGFH